MGVVEVEVIEAVGRGTFVHKPEVATVVAFRTAPDRRSDLIVVGPRTRGSYNPDKTLPVCIRLRLRPGQARALLGVSADELVDRTVPLTDLWGRAARELTERMAAAGDDMDLAVGRLAEKFRPGQGNPLVTAATRAISQPGARLSEVAERLGVGERHLRNLFAREVGLSPKHYARISRVRTDSKPAFLTILSSSR